MKHIKIPDEWTPEEALHVAGFLQSLIEAIWTTHGTRINKHRQRMHNLRNALDSKRVARFQTGDDGIPF